MQEINDQVIALDSLQIEARRKIVRAAKIITGLRLRAVTAESGIFPSNLYAFLSGAGKSLGVDNQFVVMRNYGFASSGQLLKCLHSWFITDAGSFELMRECISHEKGICNVTCQLVFTEMLERELVGAYVEFQSAGKEFAKNKLLITLNSNAIDAAAFQVALSSVFGSTMAMGAELGIDNAVSRNVWRWKFGRAERRKTAVSVPAKNSIYPYDFDFLSRDIPETASHILEEMLPRFVKLSAECALLKGRKQSSWDANLIKRASVALGVSDEND